MPFCKHCGEEIFENIPHECKKNSTPVSEKAEGVMAAVATAFRTVKTFLSMLSARLGIKDENTDYYESGKKIIPDSIATDEGEILVKQYDNVAILQTKIKVTRAKGRMQVTNKRIVFRANGFSPAGKITYQQEFALDKLDGVELRKDYRFRFLDLLFIDMLCSAVLAAMRVIGGELPSAVAILLGVICCVPFFIRKKHWMMKALFLGASLGLIVSSVKVEDPSEIISVLFAVVSILQFIAAFLYSFKPNLVMEFKTGGAHGVQVRHKDSLFSFKHEEYSGFAEVLPDKDTDLAIKEIGAIINDIKTLGDLGVEKWRVE